MNRCSFFVKDVALFGSYPLEEEVTELEDFGVRYFVDLTETNEKGTIPYTTRYKYFNYPIKDHRIPSNWSSFAQFITKISGIIKTLKTEKIYIHCRAGHGRSGLFVACLLCNIYGFSPSESLNMTSIYHSKRIDMKEKWRKIGSPQTRSQKHFVAKFFEPLYIYKNYTKYFSTEFSNESNHTVNIPNIGTFVNADVAFNTLKPKYPDIDILMYKILSYKFNQHDTIKKNLLNTGLRPIIMCSNDPYWGSTDVKNKGTNMFGKLLSKLRNNLH